MKRNSSLAFWTLLLSVIAFASAQAQTHFKSRLPSDENVLRATAERGFGVAIFDGRITRPDYVNGRCSDVGITVGTKVDGQWRKETFGASGRSVFSGLTFAGVAPLPAGEYVVMTLTCRNGRNTTHYNGPHAKFEVRAGEVVNVGALALHYQSDGTWQRTGTAHREVQDIPPETMTYIKERLPKSTAKIVKRPMTLVGPADIRIRFPSGILG